MIIHDCEQNSPEWLIARCGKPTASCFDKIITPGGKRSTQSDAYCNTILAEMMIGHCVEGYKSQWMERGHELESEAVSFYELQNDVDCIRAGFITTDDGKIGASPDRIIGTDGLLEIKCPAPHTHVEYLLNKQLDKDYYPQIQGQLYVTDRKWVDIISYHPELPPCVITVSRDNDYIKLMDGFLNDFLLLLDTKRGKLVEMGFLKNVG